MFNLSERSVLNYKKFYVDSGNEYTPCEIDMSGMFSI